MTTRLAILVCVLSLLAQAGAQDVLITEFLAANSGGLRDENGDSSDWIELFNAGTNSANLNGWYLTDTAANLVKWRFPATNLPANGFLIVFASGKNRAVAGAPLHANFKLDGGGEFLALVKPDGLTTATQFTPAYPTQTVNVSYGFAMSGFTVLTNTRTFMAPTPGGSNDRGEDSTGPAISDVTHQPMVPQDGEDLFVTARVAATVNVLSSVTLHYLVMFGPEVSLAMFDDGAHGDAQAGDSLYGAVIPANAANPGEMVRWFITARDSTNNQTRQPPIGDTNNSSLYFGTVVQDPELTNSMAVLHWFTQSTINSTTFQRASFYWRGEFYDNVKMNVHGQSSQGFRNHSFNVDFNPDHNFQWAEGENRVDDINLLSSYADKSHMRLLLSYQIYADSGPRAPYHFCVPVRMQSNGVFHSIMHVTENGDDKYLKRLGRDPNGAMYNMNTQPTDPAMAEKKTRLWEDKTDFNTFVAGINSATNRVYLYDNLDVSEAANFFAAMIVTASVDCCHKNFYLYRDSDGDGEWEMLPWDLDLSFGRNWTSAENDWDDRVYPNNGLNIGGSFPLGPNTFFNTAADKASFRAMYLRRVRTLQDELLQTNGTPAAQLNFERQIDYWTGHMAADGALDLAKWGSWGQGNGGDGGPNSGTRIDNPTVICRNTAPVQPSVPCWRTLSDAAAELKTNYLFNRRAFVFTQKMNNAAEFPDAQPTNVNILVGSLDYNPSSGSQAQEYLQLINTNSFSVDISGWKLSGAIDHTFQGGVVIPRAGLSNTLYVVADKKAFRSRSLAPKGGQGLYVEGPYKGQLSARGESIILTDKFGHSRTTTYQGNPTLAQSYLRITELMYHPVRADGPAGTEDEYEYIELKNISTNLTLNLTGVHFVTGIEFSFSGSPVTNLSPGQTVLIVKNVGAFTARYGLGFSIAGQYLGSLINVGENLRLDDAVGEKILDFSYDNQWYPITDGPGFSLVIVDENASWETWGLKTSWRPSAYDYGSPGATDLPPPPTVVSVLINEVLSHAVAPYFDAIELWNPTEADADIAGWYVSDDLTRPKKFRFPEGTVIPAGDFLALDETVFNPFGNPSPPGSFSFAADGEEVYLFSANAAGDLTGYAHGFRFGPAEINVSFGRYVTSVGEEHFVAQSAMTFATSNPYPKVGPVVLSEIMYHPQDVLYRGGLVDNQIDEFIELHNITDNPVPLYNTNVPPSTWQLRDAVDFTFPPGVIIPPHGFVVVVSFNPTNASLVTSFRNRYGVAGPLTLFGPYSGKLDNSSDSVELVRLDNPQPSSAPNLGFAPYILADKVNYQNIAPWPPSDGFGPALARVSVTGYGNDVTNWIAAAPSPGNALGSGTPPVITTQPATQAVFSNTTVMFSVGATGGPLAYQWTFNGGVLPGATNAVLILPLVQPAQSGQYQVIVLNPAGAVASSSATLMVLPPITIVTQPALINTPPTSNVTVFVVTSSPRPVSYQWRFNGTNIPNATSSSLTLTNVQSANDGLYSVLCSDEIDSVTSISVRITVLVAPFIVQQPLSQSVVTNGTVVLSVGITNTATLPISYRWRRGSSTLTNLTLMAYTSFFTVTNVNAGISAATANTNWTVIVTNSANAGSAILSSNAFLFPLLADTDHDGLPDIYETDNGFDPDVADALVDADGDGMTNGQEYIAGTDPRDPLSYLRIEPPILSGETNSAILQFFAVSNRTYAIEARSAADSGLWSRVAEVAAASTNRLMEITETNPSGVSTQRVYRLVTPRLP